MTRDLNGLRAAIKQALPSFDIRVEGLGEGVVLLGNVSSPLESQQAFDIASRLVDDGKKVVNGITIHGRDQVMLKVTVAEVQRDVIKQLGVDLTTAGLGFGSAVLDFKSLNPFSVYGQALVPTNAITTTWRSISYHAAGDGTRRRRAHSGRAEPDRDLGRNRHLPCRRRISNSGRLYLHGRYHPWADRKLPIPDPMEEVRRRAEFPSRLSCPKDASASRS